MSTSSQEGHAHGSSVCRHWLVIRSRIAARVVIPTMLAELFSVTVFSSEFLNFGAVLLLT